MGVVVFLFHKCQEKVRLKKLENGLAKSKNKP